MTPTVDLSFRGRVFVRVTVPMSFADSLLHRLEVGGEGALLPSLEHSPELCLRWRCTRGGDGGKLVSLDSSPEPLLDGMVEVMGVGAALALLPIFLTSSSVTLSPVFLRRRKASLLVRPERLLPFTETILSPLLIRPSWKATPSFKTCLTWQGKRNELSSCSK